MDRYVYLAASLFLAVLALGIVIIRRDLRRKAVLVGLLGGSAGVISELFYFRDYWQPLTTVGIGRFSPEDFLFGAAITSLSYATYPFLRSMIFTAPTYPRHKKLYGLLFIIGASAMVIFNLWLGINSIVVSSTIFAAFAVVMLLLRPDLSKVASYTTLAILVVITVLYVVLCNVVAPHYWDTYWLLAHTRLGTVVFGRVPLTELLWYGAWVLFASISYPFVSGKTLQKKAS